jgi:type I restriction enzyme S subunit
MTWPKAALGECMQLAQEAHPVELGKSYPNLGIYSFGRGVFAKPPIESMKTSATTLYKVKAGQFIYSRLFAFEGAYTIVPNNFDGVFVSNEFPTFTVRSDRAMPAYLGWLFRWPETWRLLRLQSVGLGDRRQRVHPERLLLHEAPLPPLEQQQRIVVRLDAAAGAVAARRSQAIAVEAEIAATLRAAFSRITADAPRARMGDVAPLVRRPVAIDPQATYPELGIRSFGRGIFVKPDLTGAELTWQTLFRIEEGDLVFSNIKAWEGAFAVAEAEHHGKHGSHRYLTCVPDPERATARFLWYYLQSEEGLLQVGQASPGSADRNRTFATKRMASITVPMPSLDAQQWFDHLQAKARAARNAQSEADSHLNRLLPALLYETFGE